MSPYRWLKRVILFGGLGIFVFTLLSPPIFGLTVTAQRALGVFFLTVSFWITGDPLPPAVTGLMVLALVPLLDILPATETFALFGNRAVFFILGAFILAAGLMKSGLARRVSLQLLHAFQGSVFRLVSGIFLTANLLAYLMPAHAAAALLFPVVLRIAHDLRLPKEHRRFEALLFLAMAWGSGIGGIATPLGGARAPLAIGMLQEEFGISIQFFQWTFMAWPLSIFLTLFGLAYLYLLTRGFQGKVDLYRIREDLSLDRSPWKPEEQKIAVVFGLALVAWIFLNHKVDMAVVAVIAAVLLFILRVLTWRDVENYVNWGVILMYGGAIVLGKTLVASGGAAWLADRVILPLAHTPWQTFAIFAALALILTEAMSNVATVAFLLPILYGIVQPLGVSPFLATLTVTLPAGLAFMLPVGAPPNAIAFSSGRYSVAFGVKRGWPLTIVAFLGLLVIARFLWPALGVRF